MKLTLDNSEILLVQNLCKTFAIEDSFFQRIKRCVTRKPAPSLVALEDLTFSVRQGETLGILGESGSGKSTLARVLMGIYDADAGGACLLGREIAGARGAQRLAILREMQMVFQDPFGSLDPRMNVRQIITEPLKIHGIKPSGAPDEFFIKALAEVGLEAGALERYPSEFSGGQRQRIGICRALILSPKLIIADEAVSALDVSVQAQILELLTSLRVNRQLSMIFISHDVAVVRQISDRIILLYRGHLVEELPADSLIDGSRHPYTQRLLQSALFLREGNSLKNRSERLLAIQANSTACCYRSICPVAEEKCQQKPELREVAPGHRVACWKA